MRSHDGRCQGLEEALTDRSFDAAVDMVLSSPARDRFRATSADGSVTFERRTVIGDGEFELSDVLVSPQRQEGIPLSPLLARFAASIDGNRPVEALIRDLVAGLEPGHAETAARAAVTALSLLYVDGAVRIPLPDP